MGGVDVGVGVGVGVNVGAAVAVLLGRSSFAVAGGPGSCNSRRVVSLTCVWDLLVLLLLLLIACRLCYRGRGFHANLVAACEYFSRLCFILFFPFLCDDGIAVWGDASIQLEVVSCGGLRRPWWVSG